MELRLENLSSLQHNIKIRFIKQLINQFFPSEWLFSNLINSIYISLAVLINLLMPSFFEKKKTLWRDGETTIPYVSQEACLSRQKRFKHFSIYWPEKAVSVPTIHKKRSDTDEAAKRISKLIDEQQKNELRMNKANSSLKKLMSKTTGFKDSPRETFSNFRPSTTNTLSKENQKIVERLTLYKDIQQSKLRDRHGHRTNIFENQEDDFLFKLSEGDKFKGTETGFYTSRRINLNLPHNYYPGPGTYEIKRYLENSQQKSKSLRRGN